MWQKAGEEKEFVDCYSKIVNSRVKARLVAVKEALIQVASLGLHEFIALVERKQVQQKCSKVNVIPWQCAVPAEDIQQMKQARLHSASSSSTPI